MKGKDTIMSKFDKKIARRDFLKGAGATAVGVAAVSVSYLMLYGLHRLGQKKEGAEQ